MNIQAWTTKWATDLKLRVLASPQTASTNTDAKNSLGGLSSRALVITDHQTAGRGRGAHSWTTKPGDALLSSWVFQSKKAPQPIFSALIGLALYEAARDTWPNIPWALRAPNDLHIVETDANSASPQGENQSRKIAGLLIELVSHDASHISIIIGLGLNVLGAPEETTPYPATFLKKELENRATPEQAALTEADWNLFLNNWLKRCEAKIVLGTSSLLEKTDIAALEKALKKHPEFQALSAVEPDGSLVFSDGRRTHWTEL
ncbi:MAG: hypothetical protein RBT63_03105 [Bdellovibrionales bacterium]|jgi:BirA family biotin operon repressor/biotin-[acetyl-CoA-carboxylase] ligase|nr:hypothetical protein [Bdellovibrionales bacterium]